MNNTNEITKFEFILTLEGNIVCQRYFNVKEYNPKSKNSLDIYDTIKNITNEITGNLAKKTFDYLSENHNYYGVYGVEDDEDTTEDESFLIEIKLDDEINEHIINMLRNNPNGLSYLEIFDNISKLYNNFFMDDFIKFVIEDLNNNGKIQQITPNNYQIL